MVIESVRATISAGFSAVLILGEDGPLRLLAEAEGAKVSVVRSPVVRKSSASWGGVFRLLFDMVSSAPRVVRALRIARADIVWTNTLTQPQWVLLSRLCGLRVVCHVREAENEAGKLVRMMLVAPLLLADVVVCNSEFTKGFVTRNLRLLRQPVVLYNGKDWAPYFRSEPRAISGNARIAVVGRLSPRKGQDIAIRALALLRERGIECEMRLVGEVFRGYEWYRAELLSLARNLDVLQQCELRGFSATPQTDLDWADIVLVPSRTEPFGTAAAEGMAAMRPTIVSAVDGLTEIVTHDVDGLLVPPNDPEALADAIASVLMSPATGGRLAREGHRAVELKFSSAAYARGVQELLNRVQ